MHGRATTRLRRLAAQVGAKRPPYYVRKSDIPPTLEDSFPVDGWYWVPPGHDFAVFLAANELRAAIRLHTMIRNQEETDAHAG